MNGAAPDADLPSMDATPAKICIDARVLGTSTGTYAERLLEHLQAIDSRNHYTVLVSVDRSDVWRPKASNFTVHPIDVPYYSFAEQFELLRLLNTRAFDLVHFCMPQQPVLYRGLTVTTFHDLTLLRTYNSDKGWLKFHAKQLVGRAAFKRAARTSSRIITPTQYTARDLERWEPSTRAKTVVTYEAAELEVEDFQAVALPFDRFLLYVGSQSDYKNVKALVDAHQRLRQSDPTLGLVLCGRIDDAATATMQHCASTGAANVHFTDFVTSAERNWLYTNARAYVFPSLMEGFGLPGLEAMLLDCPVVSSNATCLPEVYGEAAEYFDPRSPEAIVAAVARVLGDETRRAELIALGRQKIASYSWRRMAEETHLCYLDALKTACNEPGVDRRSAHLDRR